ncbi:MAG: hypothetical protein KDC87_12085, partial [Planctomycetes bacterium]|nr:hypothetical protein [Planctomycetota bacterium]
SDLYSLGLVLYEIYTGKQLFDAGSMTELLQQHRDPPRTQHDRLRGIDPRIDELLTRLLDRDPNRRPRSAIVAMTLLPGGDPLSTAATLGETPSPELVADAGGTPTLGRATGLALVLLIAIGWLLVGWLGKDVKLLGRARLPRSGEVLAQQAQDLVDRFFRPSAAQLDRHAATWRFECDTSLLDATKRMDGDRDRWERRLSAQRPSVLHFVYRWNPTATTARNIKGRSTWDDPPFTTPGMCRLRLDPEGRLVELEAIPAAAGSFDAPPPTAPTGVWSGLLAAAGLDASRLQAVEPHFVHRMPHTQARAWEGTDPTTGVRIRAEAAAQGIHPVSLLVRAYTDPTASDLTLARAPTPPRRYGWRLAALVTLIGIALLMARAALMHHRSDRRGATRFGATVFGLVVTFTLLNGDHGGQLAGLADLVLLGMAHGAAIGAMSAVFYLALEPHIRRVWPQTIISWSRLMRGRFTDALLASDVLIGVAIGVGTALLHIELHQLGSWLTGAGSPPLIPSERGLDALLGPIHSVGAMLETLVDLGRQSMLCVLALVIFRLVLRSRTMAAVAMVAAFTLAWSPEPLGGTSWMVASLARTALVLGTFAVALVRFGFVAMIVAVTVHGTMIDLPLTLDLDVWYAGSTLLSLGLVGGATVFGYLVGTRGRTGHRQPG